MKTEVSNWWEQAKKDLSAAKNSVKSGDYEWASFQSNQAAEKALKALHIKLKKSNIQSHNLIKIGESLSAPREIKESLMELNPEYTLSRYPDVANAMPSQNYSERKASEKIKHAEEIIKWTEKQLKR